MNWRGLLVSVRSRAEATEALAGGAAILDGKEPLAGPLGAASPGVIGEIAREVGRQRPWTIACGELNDGIEGIAARIDGAVAAIAMVVGDAALPAAFKVGLAGMAERPWREWLAAVRGRVPAEIAQVAVAYADWQRAAAPPPLEVIEAARSLGYGILLIDTFDKDAAGLLGTAPSAEIAGWVGRARSHGLAVALAGRVTIAEIPAVQSLGPDVVALRSAVCSNGRTGLVERRLVRDALAAASQGESPP
ncbi:MAG: (5-formylfuran-3-yl)methyl phosphate synthase [Planctomycetia bacterium]